MKSGMTLGVLGAGQLGRMLALSAYELGLRPRFFDVDPDAPAGHVAPLTVGRFDDPAALDAFARGLDAATFEFENVPAAAVRRMSERVGGHAFPPADALEIAQDRLSEKRFFERVGIPVPDYAAVSTRDELLRAVGSGGAVGLPAVVKTRRFGYDGKGQAVVRSPQDAERAWAEMAGQSSEASLLVERLVPFTREVSVIGARGSDGSVRVWAPVWNTHERGILRRSIAPAPSEQPVLAAAVGHITRLLNELNYVGVLALELFERDGTLYGNEMAPRVHNSGHWTIEGAATSQFEQHIRAVCGLPLGDVSMIAPAAAMVNIIGSRPDVRALLAIEGAHVHWYGKEPRPGRKVGHVTVCGDAATVARGIERVEAICRS